MPELNGTYFYADYCAGWVRSFKYDGAANDRRQWELGTIGFITSFGVDANGELYLTSATGRLYRFARG
jgi:hypothetical protein